MHSAIVARAGWYLVPLGSGYAVSGREQRVSKTKSEKEAEGPAQALIEAEARETALREILRVISQSRTDERSVIDAVLESAARLCGSPVAAPRPSRRPCGFCGHLGRNADVFPGWRQLQS